MNILRRSMAILLISGLAVEPCRRTHGPLPLSVIKGNAAPSILNTEAVVPALMAGQWHRLLAMPAAVWQLFKRTSLSDPRLPDNRGIVPAERLSDASRLLSHDTHSQLALLKLHFGTLGQAAEDQRAAVTVLLEDLKTLNETLASVSLDSVMSKFLAVLDGPLGAPALADLIGRLPQLATKERTRLWIQASPAIVGFLRIRLLAFDDFLRMGNYHGSPQVVDLDRMLRNMVEVFQPSSNVAITVHVQRYARWVWADPRHLATVLHNLVENAVMRGWAKSIEIRVRRVPNRVDRLQIEIIDNGQGIEPELREGGRLFEKGVSGFRGLGLGLWQSQQIVEAAGGTITVDSLTWKEIPKTTSDVRTRAGTTFVISLPTPQLPLRLFLHHLLSERPDLLSREFKRWRHDTQQWGTESLGSLISKILAHDPSFVPPALAAQARRYRQADAEQLWKLTRPILNFHAWPPIRTPVDFHNMLTEWTGSSLHHYLMNAILIETKLRTRLERLQSGEQRAALEASLQNAWKDQLLVGEWIRRFSRAA